MCFSFVVIMHINNPLRQIGTKNPICKDTKKYYILPKKPCTSFFKGLI